MHGILTIFGVLCVIAISISGWVVIVYYIMRKQILMRKIRAKLIQRELLSNDAIDLIIHSIVMESGFSTTEEVLRVARHGWKLIADEAVVDDGYLRPDDRISTICQSGVIGLSNNSMELLETFLVAGKQLDQDTNLHTRFDTVKEYIICCASRANYLSRFVM